MASTRSILLRGVSCSYDNTTISKQRVLWYIYKDANNYTQLYLDNTAKTFNYQKCVSGTVTTLSSNAQTFNKWQVFNILCQQTATGMKMSILKNNGTYETYSNASATYFEGASSLYPLTKNATGNEADAFMDSIVYLPNMTFDDTTAESILRGEKEGYEFPEMFKIEDVTLHANATRNNGVITLNATETGQNSFVDIPVLPNNQYKVTFTATASTGTFGINLYERYNNIPLKTNYYGYITGTYTRTFITNAITNVMRVYFGSSSAGTFTFSNISLKIKM